MNTNLPDKINLSQRRSKVSHKAYTTHGTKKTPQSSPIPGSDQVPNSAGGYAWAVDDWKRLDRFLILGSEGGTYYIKERDLTRENADGLMRCIKADGVRVVNRLVEISEGGRAPKNDPALFALAMCTGVGDPETRKAALTALPRVARIGTHLFHFLEFCKGFRGWGRGLREATADWYNAKAADQLAYQVIKYRQRDGWSHRDALRKAHPKAKDTEHNTLYQWITQGTVDTDELPSDGTLQLIWAFERVQVATKTKEVVNLITDYNLPREAIPTTFLNDILVWDALLEKMPMTATIRNLGKMTSVGLVVPMSTAAQFVVSRVTNQEQLQKSREHPLAILVALKTYEQGHGDKGKLTWAPVREVVDALDQAFYLSFGNVTPTCKRTMLALDVSGSMGCPISGMPLSCRDASGAMALVTARVEPSYVVTAFSAGSRIWGGWGRRSHNHFTVLGISPRQRLDDVIRMITDLDFGGTDCALPMVWALEQKMPIETFIIYTDSETWAGGIHPVQALAEYRNKMSIGARLIVVGMTSNGFSIADPNDAGMLDVVGFDTATPNVISDFCIE
jgi:60 kDa SS-A/Ro ribonucleoprotein